MFNDCFPKAERSVEMESVFIKLLYRNDETNKLKVKTDVKAGQEGVDRSGDVIGMM